MLTLAEIAAGVSGAWRLMWGDPGGLWMLDRSREGFWRSFRVAIFLAPLSALYLALTYTRFASDMPLSTIVLVEALRYVIDWTGFAVLLLEKCRRVGWERRYVGAVVALNWANVPVTIIVVGLAAAGEVLPAIVDTAIGLAIMVAVVAWVARILRHTLDCTWAAAVGLGIANLWMSLLLTTLVHGILGLRVVPPV